ncbi:hypothetical protein PsorP6_017214 [Peronosclerospora sorghi]|uniref:Uncharacterized protein n=1 Tax=Peronosclerospora sorghi TaxID=230839 RepID=A0ACC0WEP9_9STRA|nr:hypothetical protein PsorP6_017214 [Peronosclerospora sorghi]
MGFLTYILIVGYSKVTSNQSGCWLPVLTCLIAPFVPGLVSFSGYKYIPLVINTVDFQLLESFAYYVSLLYTGVAVSYFTVIF